MTQFKSNQSIIVMAEGNNNNKATRVDKMYIEQCNWRNGDIDFFGQYFRDQINPSDIATVAIFVVRRKLNS